MVFCFLDRRMEAQSRDVSRSNLMIGMVGKLDGLATDGGVTVGRPAGRIGLHRKATRSRIGKHV